MRVAVAFISFDRFHLAKLSLARVLQFLPKNWPLRVFQDGWIDHYGQRVGSPRRVNRALDLFASWSVEVQFGGDRNRGLAEVVFDAESWAFDQEGADCLIVIEDDIVISRHYFPMMDRLSRFALNNGRVGAFSAYGDASRHYAMQYLFRNRFVPMHHRWGVGMTRDIWSRGRADYLRYLSLLKDIPYRNRPHDQIREFLGGLRNAQKLIRITSQDAVHTAIMLHHGCFSFMSPASYAVNIGKRGMHFSPRFYHERKDHMRGRYPFFPTVVPLSEARLREQTEELYEKSVNFDYW